MCRALTVVGGAAAGTAIAWVLSTGSASADPLTNPLGDPLDAPAELVQPVSTTIDRTVNGTVDHTVDDTVDRTVDGTIDGTVDTLTDPPAPAIPITDSLRDVRGTLTDAAHVRVDAVDPVGTLPTCAVPLCEFDRVIESPADHPVGPAATPAVPTTGAPSTVAGPAIDQEPGVLRLDESAGSTHPAAPASAPNLPDLPTRPAPAPPTVPAPGHSGHVGGNSADSPLFAALSWLDRQPTLVPGLTGPATTAPGTVDRLGAQPGTSPD